MSISNIMTPKQMLYFIVFLIALLVIALLISGIPNGETSSVEVQEDFGSRVVYTTSVGVDPDPFIRDCRERGGEFSSCGSICPPDAQACAEVCAFTCENIPSDEQSNIPADWETLRSEDLDFQISYPSDMSVEETARGGISLSLNLWGPTQIDGSEFFDGISITLREVSVPENITLEEFVLEQMGGEHVNPVDGSFEELKIAGQTAFKFETLGEISIPSTTIYVRASENTALEINYVDEDPTDQGFAETVSQILETLEII